MKKFLALSLALVSVFAPAAAFASVDITLQGGSVSLYQGQSYVEPGYSANSSVDGDITNSVTASSVDTNHPGNITRDYSVTDSALDTATASRNIQIKGLGSSMPCLLEVHRYSNACFGAMMPNQTEPVVQQVAEGKLMPIYYAGMYYNVPATLTRFVPSTPAYQDKWNADKVHALANGTIDAWYEALLALATTPSRS